ncbi:hypothetical protein PT015_09600 [Candidatus Mycobacterium wuenschmannii]|uniref:Secreted protein n=1 Tax=Candidatus Mycobacterium wuenschmannii TaxID=3027808 RepID=A0ABY8W3N9_9MYCO|nr:hypothetical protein [Candidatus Mycobacterium wuenschmannii]WIM89652.1 hypothetical protein PT015_09600 [Candidatus Mycobacterium wuenschmannii]
MTINRALTRAIGAALLTGGLATAGLGGSGVAQAHQPHHWCPGDPMTYPAGPGPAYNWDMNICHTWYWVTNGKGNVPYKGSLPSTLFDGEVPPPDSQPSCGRDMFTGAQIDC